MQHQFSLAELPVEVLHQILSNLSVAELVTLRPVSQTFKYLATSGTHWRKHLLDILVPKYAALFEIKMIPPRLWSFGLIHDGWFRAYCEVSRIIGEPWLRGDDDLVGCHYFVYFKAHLRYGGVGVEEYHSVVRFTDQHVAEAVEGLPLHSRVWRIEDGVMKVSAYPPNMPGREPRSLCRKFEHVTVAMISDEPKFMSNLSALNTTVLEEATASHIISTPEMRNRKQKLEEARDQLIDTTSVGRQHRLRETLGLDARAAASSGEEEEQSPNDNSSVDEKSSSESDWDYHDMEAYDDDGQWVYSGQIVEW